MTRRIRAHPAVAAAALLALFASSGHAGDAPLEATVRLNAGGEGGWDYLVFDPDGRRLFVSRSTHVQVVNAAGDSVIGDIPNTPGVHGVALVPETGKGFTSNGRDSSVTVFDLKTLATLAVVKLPARNPDAILYDPGSKRVFTFNGGSASATAIDPATNRVVGTVALEGKPEAAVADGKGRVFVNIEDKSTLVCFDAKKLRVLSSWPLAPGEEPTGLAFDRAHARLFSACGNGHMIVLDLANGKHVADLPIGGRVDGVAFDPALGWAVSSNGEGTLSVVREDSPDRFTKLADVPSQRGARTITLDPARHRFYTCTAQFEDAPPPSASEPRPRPKMVPGTFVILGFDAATTSDHAH